jgi:hypothetical protein
LGGGQPFGRFWTPTDDFAKNPKWIAGKKIYSIAIMLEFARWTWSCAVEIGVVLHLQQDLHRRRQTWTLWKIIATRGA